ncbi:MAG: hypothetical protein QNJ94_18685 [Alphaproteobacteria bacterium]|nr:hypothetical protein [Alphaproteobacteria bacterium]
MQAEGVQAYVLPDKLKLGRRTFRHLADYRLEMQEIYRRYCQGELDAATASRLSWMVDNLRRARKDEQLMEVAQKGGIAGVPFVGIQFVGPDDADRS